MGIKFLNKSQNPIFFITLIKGKKGVTLIEVLITLVIITVGIIGLLSSLSSVTLYNNRAQQKTLATQFIGNKMETIKRYSINEPSGGSFGYDYLISTTGFLSDMTSSLSLIHI